MDDWELNLHDCWKLVDPCDQGAVDADHFVDFCLRRVLVSLFLDVNKKDADEFLTAHRSCRQLTLARTTSNESSASSPLGGSPKNTLNNTLQRRQLLRNGLIDWDGVNARLPLSDDVAGKAARSELWRRFDVNGR